MVDGLILRVVGADDGDARELAELTGALRGDLLALDVAAVDPVEERDLPERAKGLGSVAGWLAVRLGSEKLRGVVTAVSDWATRSNRTVEVSFGSDVLKVTGVTSAQQEKIIEAWLARHGTGA